MTDEDTAPLVLRGAGAIPLREVAVHLHPRDNVAIATRQLEVGTVVAVELAERPLARIPVRQAVPPAHKLALEPIPRGEAVRRYGQTIGFATQDIAAGDHVHLHNVGAPDFPRDAAVGSDVRRVARVAPHECRTFLGYRRPDGRVGTRNYLAVIGASNCSAHVTRAIAHAFPRERLATYRNVDGVIALAHSFGCSTRIGGLDYELLQRTLAGMAAHPNVGACILVGLGCEVNQVDALVEAYDLCACNLEEVRRARSAGLPGRPPTLLIQQQGGIRKTVAAGVAAVEALLPKLDAMVRTPEPLSELVVGLQCGGSDGWSGITANPAVGLVSDEIVRQGGTVVLGETTEIYGAEHLLTRRAASPEVAERLLAHVRWWEAYARAQGFRIDNNPTPGNKAGGLTTIYEKSLGAVAKAGSTPLMDVVDYAEPVRTRGLVFMNTPGNDWTAVTGLVAGGCTLVLFTTGRGSVFGYKPAPVVKVGSNSALAAHMGDDIDLDAGRVLDGVPLAEVAGELLDLAVAVASGQRSRSEDQDVGEAEFVPWQTVGVL